MEHKIKLITNEFQAKLFLNGKDISDITKSVIISVYPNELPEVIVGLIGDIEIDMDGVNFQEQKFQLEGQETIDNWMDG